MSKLPYTDRTEVLILRISKKEKEQLTELAKKGKYGNNYSEVIRSLIRKALLVW